MEHTVFLCLLAILLLSHTAARALRRFFLGLDVCHRPHPIDVVNSRHGASITESN